MRYDLLHPKAVRAALIEAGVEGVPTERQVRRWITGDTPMPAWARRAIEEVAGTQKEPLEPTWLEGLVREVRMNREAIREAMLGPGQPDDAALVEMVKSDLRPLFEGLAAQFRGEVRQLLAERFGETDED